MTFLYLAQIKLCSSTGGGLPLYFLVGNAILENPDCFTPGVSDESIFILPCVFVSVLNTRGSGVLRCRWRLL